MNLIISTLLLLLLAGCSSSVKLGIGNYSVVVCGEIEVVDETSST
jgi:hypothetical protein